MIEDKNIPEKNIKLYKNNHIGIATYIGGPLAAGYLAYENFKALHKPNSARNALIIGIISTILLFGVIFSIPENIFEKIPRIIIPAIYTAIVYFLIQKYQGENLEKHAKNDNPFFSAWRAIGIGLVSLVVIGAGTFAYVYLTFDNEVYDKYDQEMEAFYENEEQALKFYDNIEAKSDNTLLDELNRTVIPNWEQNIQIIEEISRTETLPSDLSKENKVISEYSKLRLELSLLIKESILEQTDKHIEIEEIEDKINSVLNTLRE